MIFPLHRSPSSSLLPLTNSDKIDLDGLTEFYALAATLLYIKSRMLLPVEIDLSDEIDDPRKDLVEKLIEYQKFKKLSELMEQKNWKPSGPSSARRCSGLCPLWMMNCGTK
jgi:hypothetical protein